VAPELDPKFGWLKPPILNGNTRLVVVADARQGRLVAQGYEDKVPATAPLELSSERPGRTS
jgi:hypothetical protein